MTKKAKKPRGPYRCALCRDYGHRKDKCTKARTAEMILNSLPGDTALRSLIPEQFQILAIIESQTHQGLIGAIQGNQRLAEAGKPHNNSLVNAWTELAKYQAGIPSNVVEHARQMRAALLAAEDAYHQAIAPIREALGQRAPDLSWRHPLKTGARK